MTPKGGYFQMKNISIYNGIYNSQNDRMWAVSREETDKR